jgi:hypothetical protein
MSRELASNATVSILAEFGGQEIDLPNIFATLIFGRSVLEAEFDLLIGTGTGARILPLDSLQVVGLNKGKNASEVDDVLLMLCCEEAL